uniref:Uncharacterized protein n=1 Tax=Triticum urartu TaxID=4572 RepID=A0A8R7QQS2_TRIUA
MAATACSTALLGVAGARLPAGAPPTFLLPRRHFSPRRLQGADDAPRLSLLRAKASSDDTSAASGDELVDDLKAKVLSEQEALIRIWGVRRTAS